MRDRPKQTEALSDRQTKEQKRICLAKRRFARKGKAIRATNALKDRQSVQMRAYFCPICKGYHLTSNNYH